MIETDGEAETAAAGVSDDGEVTVGAAAKAEGGAGDGEGTTAAGPRGASWATRPPPNARTTRGPSGRLAEEAVVEEAAGESPATADPAGKTEGAWGDDDKAIEPAGGGSGAASWDAEVRRRGGRGGRRTLATKLQGVMDADELEEGGDIAED